MNVPYNEINLSDAARMLGLDYSTLSGWCRNNRINFIDLSNGTTKPRYMLLDKEVEHLKSEKKKHGNQFIRYYDKNWDLPQDTEELDYEEYLEDEEETSTPPSEISDVVREDEKKAINIDNITTTISYMQDINDRLAAIDKEIALLNEQINDYQAEKNQLTNEYLELKKEVVNAL